MTRRVRRWWWYLLGTYRIWPTSERGWRFPLWLTGITVEELDDTEDGGGRGETE